MYPKMTLVRISVLGFNFLDIRWLWCMDSFN